MEAHRGPISNLKKQHLRFYLDSLQVNRKMIQQQEALIIPDILGDTPLAKRFRQVVGNELKSTLGYIRSWLGVPLVFKGKMLGLITLDHSQPNFYSAQHADLILIFANQVAITIENARLYSQAEDTAIASERNRLARDLHDAVTQTLFSANVIAEVLPKLWKLNPEVGEKKLKELSTLTRGALSEMRTLLFELRPDTLGDVDLGDLFMHLANAFSGRTLIPIDFTQEGQSALQSDVKEVFYRVSQEALNNIAKHAEATQVKIHLNIKEDQVEVMIQDNGKGFDKAKLSPENLGMKIMRERADSIHATFEIKSIIGAGTQIHLHWQSKEEL